MWWYCQRTKSEPASIGSWSCYNNLNCHHSPSPNLQPFEQYRPNGIVPEYSPTFSRNIPIALRYDVMNSGSTVFCEQPFHVWLYKGPLGRPGRHFTSASSACMKIFIFIHASISTSFLQLTTASMYWYCFYSSCSDNTLRRSLYEDLNENWASCCSGRNGVLLGNPKKWDVCEEVSCSEELQP